MELTTNQKYAAIAIGTLILGVSTTVAAKALYSNVKIGTDKKTLIISSGIAIGTMFIIAKHLRKGSMVIA